MSSTIVDSCSKWRLDFIHIIIIFVNLKHMSWLEISVALTRVSGQSPRVIQRKVVGNLSSRFSPVRNLPAVFNVEALSLCLRERI